MVNQHLARVLALMTGHAEGNITALSGRAFKLAWNTLTSICTCIRAWTRTLANTRSHTQTHRACARRSFVARERSTESGDRAGYSVGCYGGFCSSDSGCVLQEHNVFPTSLPCCAMKRALIFPPKHLSAAWPSQRLALEKKGGGGLSMLTVAQNFVTQIISRLDSGLHLAHQLALRLFPEDPLGW